MSSFWQGHLAYSVTYSVVPINPSLLAITLKFSVIITLIYNDTQEFHEVINKFDSISKNVTDTGVLLLGAKNSLIVCTKSADLQV